MFVNDAPLKSARASWSYYRGSRQPATPVVQKVSGARQNHATIAGNVKALGCLFARLAGSRDALKATAHTLSRLRSKLPMTRVELYQHVR
jgi:hypothetical protein